jgi:hypothetical protein
MLTHAQEMRSVPTVFGRPVHATATADRVHGEVMQGHKASSRRPNTVTCQLREKTLTVGHQEFRNAGVWRVDTEGNDLSLDLG